MNVGRHCPLVLGVLVELRSAARVTFLTPDVVDEEEEDDDDDVIDLRFALSRGLLL